MNLLSIIRNRFRSDSNDDSVSASRVVIEESKQARMRMNEQAKQVRHDAFQTSIDQEHIRSNIISPMIVRKTGPDFLDDALINQKGRS